MKPILTFDVCALAMFALMGLFIMRQKLYHGRNNRIFFALIISGAAATLGDLFNSIAENYFAATYANKIWMYMFNYVYFVAHNLVMFLFVHYIYASLDIWHIYKKDKKLSRIWWGLMVFDGIVIALNGTLTNVFYISDDVAYHRGPSLMLLYVVAFILAVWGLFVIVKYHAIASRDKETVLYLLYPILGAGILIQALWPHVLVEMFTVAVSMLFFMVTVRREESQIDPVIGAYKSNEGIIRIKNGFVTDKPTSLIFVKITNYANLQLYIGLNGYNEFLRMLTEKFDSFARESVKNADIYYMEEGLFCYMIDGYAKEGCHKLAHLTQKYLDTEIEMNGIKILPEACCCIALLPMDIDTVSGVFTLARTFHETMPQNEKIHLYSDYREDVNYKIRSNIKEILKRGLANNSFEMYYQPIYSLTEEKFVSAEALVRLKDEEYGTISPGIFIPMAEKEGCIHELGDFIIEDVIRFISENEIARLGLRYVEVNLSPSQCIEADLIDKIKGFLDRYSVNPQSLSLELTENAADINPAIVDHNIEALHDYGIRIALDDYGTGYSNIKRVTSLPIDEVKLDKSFVDMIDDERMWIVIKDTIKMLKEMGKEVLVEGVEKQDVADKFKDINTDLFLGCELIQGFLFCKPLPEKEFIKFIKEHM